MSAFEKEPEEELEDQPIPEGGEEPEEEGVDEEGDDDGDPVVPDPIKP